MSEEKTTKEYFKNLVEGLNYIAEHLDSFNESIKRDAEEIKKLNSIIDELRDENESLKSVNREMSEDLMRIARGGDA